MGLLDTDLGEGRHWSRVGDGYEVTKKPRNLDRSTLLSIPFAAMDAIPQSGAYLPEFTMKAPEAIASGIYFERGDILVGKITPSFENGKQALVQELSAPFGYATTEVIPLHRRSDQHDPRLLFFYLLHPDVRHYVTERMEGSTGRKRVPENVLLDLPIPAIEPNDQIAIADALEVIQRASAAETKCEQMARGLKRAAMQRLFTRGLKGEAQKETEIGPMPESWAATPLAETCALSTGTTPATKRADFYVGSTPFIKTAEIVNNRISQASTFLSDQAVSEYNLRLYPPGTLLMAMYGQGKTRGQVSLLEISATTSQNAAAIETNEKLRPDFLWHYLLSRYEYLRGIGSLGHLSHLNLGYLREFQSPLPPTIAEQEAIVSILDAIDRKIDLHKRKRTVLDELFKALLHKLMTGEIQVRDLDRLALHPLNVAEAAA